MLFIYDDITDNVDVIDILTSKFSYIIHQYNRENLLLDLKNCSSIANYISPELKTRNELLFIFRSPEANSFINSVYAGEYFTSNRTSNDLAPSLYIF